MDKKTNFLSQLLVDFKDVVGLCHKLEKRFEIHKFIQVSRSQIIMVWIHRGGVTAIFRGKIGKDFYIEDR